MRDKHDRPIIGFGELISTVGMVGTDQVYEGMRCLLVAEEDEVDLCGTTYLSAASLSGKWGKPDKHYTVDYVFPPELQEPDVTILE